MRRLVLVTVAAVSLGFSGRAAAATYYVSSAGNDAAAGTSSTAAWRSVARVNATALAPGDTILFAGGSTFAGLLQPQGSGTSASPIAFGSYGGGSATLAGGIQLTSQSWLVFDGVRVDSGAWQTAGSTRGIRTNDTGTGVQNVVVRNCQFVNVAIGLLFSNHLDGGWTVANNLIQYTRDSGILIFDPTLASEVGGSDLTFTGNQILDTGLDTSLAYNKHGAYDIGTDTVWRGNTIRRFQAAGLSVRAHGTTIEGNTIADGPYPIDVSPYDSTGATTRIVYNQLLNASGAAIEINASGAVANPESYVIANNTLTSTGSALGLRVVGTSGFLHVGNNVVVTAGGLPLQLDARPGGGFSESNDLFFSPAGTRLGFLGAVYTTLLDYQAASGAGQADLATDPLLDPSGAPAAGSPAIDAGTAGIDATLSYVGDCSGALYHYCGPAPDLGAVESGQAPPPPPPPPPPAPLAPPTGLTASAIGTTGLTLGWTASSDARVVQYQVSRDGTTVNTTTLTNATIGGLTCGTTYGFAVTGLDSAGQTSEAATTTAKTAACPDTTPPALTITYPYNGQTVALRFQITATASDAESGVKYVTFWFDGYPPCTDTTAPYVSCTISTTRGGHTIRVRATDNAGNYAEKIIHIWAGR